MNKIGILLCGIGVSVMTYMPLYAQRIGVYDPVTFCYADPINNNEYCLETESLTHSIQCKDGHLRPGVLRNMRAQTVFVPTAGSEEFRIAFVRTTEPKVTPLNRKKWKVTADSWCKESDKAGHPNFSIDGDPLTYWHSNYKPDGVGAEDMPHSLTVDLGKSTTFRSFGYLPREGVSGVRSNGNVQGYELAISNNGRQWKVVQQGELDYDKVAPVWVALAQPVKARYVRFTALTALNGQKFAACAEFYLSNQSLGAVLTPQIKASDLTLKKVHESDREGVKKVVFEMQPYTYEVPMTHERTEWQINMVMTAKRGEHFLRKYLEIVPLNAAARALPIDYIEMDKLGVENTPASRQWTHPSGSKGEGGMSAYTLTLGEPFYIEGLFFGSEFPQAENEIKGGYAHSRYYVGKPIAQISNMEQGGFRTWPNVEGASRSATDLNVVRQDFFAYIQSIARPIRLRMQYNSWYDWMMRINEKRINDSFMEMERGFSQYGVRPMDSYVVDDGWNCYGVDDKELSGEAPNKSGFWEFNSKFPTGLKGASEISHRLGSDFGIWLGPRGGYNFNQQWGKLLEKAGNGTYNQHSADAVTGDSVYVNKLLAFFLHNQKTYGVNYWKLDGFSTVAPQPSLNHRYITGGKNGNYYFTEHWERWYKNFEKMYAEAKERGSDLWLNLTCYVNPSPWILQFCNSVWMQNSMDMGRKVVDGRTRQLDQLLSYRDDRYYDFIHGNQIQFPLAHLFNHDPIYGKEYGVPRHGMTDSEFRAYLYMMATRGTAFWEMLYSYTMMNEGHKWMINAEALQFVEDNYDLLRHAIYYGNSPLAGGIYGYSCWKPAQSKAPTAGIVSFRNPSNHAQQIAFTLDNKVGVPEGASGLKKMLILDYTGKYDEDPTPQATMDSRTYAYGDVVQLTLQPGQILMYKFAPHFDTPVRLVQVRADRVDSVQLVFDQPVHIDQARLEVLLEGQQVATSQKMSLAPDFRTLQVAWNEKLSPAANYTLKIEGVKGWNEVPLSTNTFDFFVAPEGELVKACLPRDFKNSKAIKVRRERKEGIYLFSATQPVAVRSPMAVRGDEPLTVSLCLQTKADTACLVAQPGAFRFSLSEGCPVFQVGQVTYSATTRVNDGQLHRLVGVREPNGMVKIYLDGALQGTAYQNRFKHEVLPMASIKIGGNPKVEMGELRVFNRALDFKAVKRL